MDLFLLILRKAFVFLGNIYGTLVSPYKTYFKMSSYGTFYQGLIFLMLVPIYALLSSIVRNGFFRSGITTLGLSFLKTASSISLMFLLSIGAFWIVGKVMRKNIAASAIVNLWAFSYVPTYIWFGITALLYFLLPPPRLFTSLGFLFSVVFIGFSIFLFLWKLLLYYLTLRIGLKLTLYQIALASVVLFPLFGLFSLASYRLGIFRVPFV